VFENLRTGTYLCLHTKTGESFYDKILLYGNVKHYFTEFLHKRKRNTFGLTKDSKWFKLPQYFHVSFNDMRTPFRRSFSGKHTKQEILLPSLANSIPTFKHTKVHKYGQSFFKKTNSSYFVKSVYKK
jgi:hypothetical protein